jgi:hypothetical protein
MSIWEFVPPAVAAALIGVGGVFATAWWARKSHREVLRWNLQKHREDASFALRREVYIGFCDKLAAMQQAIGGATGPSADLAPLLVASREFMAYVMKIEAVGDEETIKAAQNVAARLGKLGLRVICLTPRFNDLKARVLEAPEDQREAAATNLRAFHREMLSAVSREIRASCAPVTLFLVQVRRSYMQDEHGSWFAESREKLQEELMREATRPLVETDAAVD